MPNESGLHCVFIINESEKAPFVEPKVLGVTPGDRVKFVVVADEGEEEEFRINLESNVFRSISPDEDIPAKQGSPPLCTVRPEVPSNSIHRYTVTSISDKKIDPIMLVYE